MKRRHLLLGGLALMLPKFSFAVPKAQTGIVLDKRFASHVIDLQHPESPKRYFTFIDKLARTKALTQQLKKLTPEVDATPWLSEVHSIEHIASIKRHDPAAYTAALLACGGLLTAVDAVHTGQVQNAFCASRPPGHHATNTGQEEGFCYFNHVAIAARYLQQQHGHKKILIIDWDYHHGNGTEWAFYDDPTVLCFSTHDMLAYPGTGLPSRQGTGAGEGFNINVHLPCGSGDAEIKTVFEKQLIPAAKAFVPDFILISAGFDSRKDDLLGCFNITDTGFIEITRIVKNLALQHCQGRLVSVLEGGYNIEGNALGMLAHLTALNTIN